VGTKKFERRTEREEQVKIIFRVAPCKAFFMSLYQLDVQQHELTARRRGMRRQFGLLPLDGAKVRVFPRSIGWEASGAKATMRRDVMQSIWLRFQGDSQERLGDARPGAGHCP